MRIKTLLAIVGGVMLAFALLKMFLDPQDTSSNAALAASVCFYLSIPVLIVAGIMALIDYARRPR